MPLIKFAPAYNAMVLYNHLSIYATSMYAAFAIYDLFPFPNYMRIEVALFLLYANLDSSGKTTMRSHI